MGSVYNEDKISRTHRREGEGGWEREREKQKGEREREREKKKQQPTSADTAKPNQATEVTKLPCKQTWNRPYWTNTQTSVTCKTRATTGKARKDDEDIPSIFVGDGLRLVLLNVVKKRREDPPGLVQLVRSHKVDLRSHKYIQDQALIGIWQLAVLKKKIYIKNAGFCGAVKIPIPITHTKHMSILRVRTYMHITIQAGFHIHPPHTQHVYINMHTYTGCSTTLSTSNYHWGWPILNKYFESVFCCNVYFSLVLYAYWCKRHWKAHRMTVLLIVCMLGGCCKLIWKWLLLFVKIFCIHVKNVSALKVPSDHKWGWFETSCWTDDLALQKPKLENIQPSQIAVPSSKCFQLKHTRNTLSQYNA